MEACHAIYLDALIPFDPAYSMVFSRTMNHVIYHVAPLAQVSSNHWQGWRCGDQNSCQCNDVTTMYWRHQMTRICSRNLPVTYYHNLEIEWNWYVQISSAKVAEKNPVSFVQFNGGCLGGHLDSRPAPCFLESNPPKHPEKLTLRIKNSKIEVGRKMFPFQLGNFFLDSIVNFQGWYMNFSPIILYP